MADESVIPAKQEELVGAMLGSGVALPGDCRLVSGNVEKTVIKATYACPSGEVLVELAHPDAAPSGATRTEKFALWVERGTAPADLQSVLVSRIRERENEFRWIQPVTNPRPEPTAMPIPSGAVAMLSGAVVIGLLVLAALLLWRRRMVTTRK